MTSEEQKLCQDLVIAISGRWISKEEFLCQLPSAIEGGKLASRLLEEASKGQNAQDLHCALIVGFAFGFAPKHMTAPSVLELSD